jgi:hypothetical protein
LDLVDLASWALLDYAPEELLSLKPRGSGSNFFMPRAQCHVMFARIDRIGTLLPAHSGKVLPGELHTMQQRGQAKGHVQSPPAAQRDVG